MFWGPKNDSTCSLKKYFSKNSSIITLGDPPPPGMVDGKRPYFPPFFKPFLYQSRCLILRRNNTGQKNIFTSANIERLHCYDLLSTSPWYQPQISSFAGDAKIRGWKIGRCMPHQFFSIKHISNKVCQSIEHVTFEMIHTVTISPVPWIWCHSSE